MMGFRIKVDSGLISIYETRVKEANDRLEMFEITYNINVSSGSVRIS